MNNIKYFELKEYLKKVNLKGVWNDKVEQLEDLSIAIITSTRNNGKSTSSWDLIINDIWLKHNYKYKVAIARTNDDKRKKSLGSFKSKYDKKIANEVGYHVVSDSGIITYCEHNEDGKCINESQKEIGRFISVLQEENYKSAVGSFDNYNFIFWDEFNEVIAGIHSKLWDRFINLVSTVERFNRPLTILLLGNKVNANNDIVINFDLEVTEHNKFIDYFQDISIEMPLDNGKVFKVEGRYIDIGYNTFKHLNQSTMASALASLSPSTDNMFNRGGFLEGQIYEVLNRKKFTNKKAICYYAVNDLLLEYGTFYNPDIRRLRNQECYYLEVVAQWEIKEDLEIYALNTDGYLSYELSHYLDQDDYEDIASRFAALMKNGKLFFSSFKSRESIISFIYQYLVID